MYMYYWACCQLVQKPSYVPTANKAEASAVPWRGNHKHGEHTRGSPLPAPRGVAPRSNAPPRLKPPSGLLQHHGHSPVRRRCRRITTPELYTPQQPCEDVSSGFQLHQRELVGVPLGFLSSSICRPRHSNGSEAGHQHQSNPSGRRLCYPSARCRCTPGTAPATEPDLAGRSRARPWAMDPPQPRPPPDAWL